VFLPFGCGTEEGAVLLSFVTDGKCRIERLATTLDPRNIINGMLKLPLLRGIRPLAVRLQSRRLPRLIRKEWASHGDVEAKEVLDFLASRPDLTLPLATRPPYSFVEQYVRNDIEILTEPGRPFRYVLVGPCKIYFPSQHSDEEIRAAVTTALVEQDPRSPHAYLSDDFDVEDGDTAVLAGASDGIFCLRAPNKMSL